jgi:rubrerythrin
MNSLEFAIRMELEGREYYLKQADLNQNNELKTIFIILADAEQQHANLLLQRQKDEKLTLKEDGIVKERNSFFHSLENFKPDLPRALKQLDVYRFAAEQEQKSIELYQGMLEQAVEPEDRELFSFLIKQETEHLHLFEDLVILLTRPEEWVESAEFGIREEY